MENIPSSNWTRWEFMQSSPKLHVFPFEQLDMDFWFDFAETYDNALIIGGTSIYLVLIWTLLEYMENRKAFHLRTALTIWNTLIAVFSTAATVRIGMELWLILQTHGFHEGVCFRVEGHMSTAFWGIAAGFLKIGLVGDTVFLLLRKKPVDAGHVVHHILGGVFSVKMLKYAEPLFRWLGFANMLTHSIDYSLLALTAMEMPLPKSRQLMVALEVVQMLFIIFASGYTLVLRAWGTPCMRHPSSVALCNGVALVILGFAIANVISPEYWRRGKKNRRT